ncbi:tetratricopeptide repeat protein [Candidatus Thorarchaeota archaeon]|nr:MAG: tetratricopeptide repeat protein [Candidatus Thorarchaeota archaeon]
MRLSLRKWGYKFSRERKWAVFWYLMTGTLCGLTCLVLSRTGFLPWDDVAAFLLGFFVPIVTYSFKELMGWYEYPRRYSDYAVSERYLELSLEYIEQERWEDALQYLEKILYAMPDHQRALYYAAMCKEKLGNHEEASQYIKEYLRKRPSDVEALELQKRVGAASGI